MALLLKLTQVGRIGRQQQEEGLLSVPLKRGHTESKTRLTQVGRVRRQQQDEGLQRRLGPAALPLVGCRAGSGRGRVRGEAGCFHPLWRGEGHGCDQQHSNSSRNLARGAQHTALASAITAASSLPPLGRQQQARMGQPTAQLLGGSSRHEWGEQTAQRTSVDKLHHGCQRGVKPHLLSLLRHLHSERNATGSW